MFKKIVMKTIDKHNMINKNEHIVIGVSGGADSISLLNFFHCIKDEYNLKLTAVHINHCMRGEESDLDYAFVNEFCKNLKIPLKYFKIDVYEISKMLKISNEEAGRNARYESFNKVIQSENADKIAVAHNKNDNAETILMRFIRGTGSKGLAGIPYTRDNIIRPLLDCERKTIEAYCAENCINYRIDSTNNQEIYTRNKIRLSLIPEIKENFNPNIVNNLIKMSESFGQEEKFLESIAKENLEDILIQEKSDSLVLDAEKMHRLDDVIKIRIIRYCLLHFSLHNISSKHLDMILNLLNKDSGKKISLPNDITIYKNYKKLCITNKILEQQLYYNYELNQDSEVFIKELSRTFLLSKKRMEFKKNSTKVCTICLNCDTIENSIFLRQRNNGDKITVNGMTKKIKNIFIDSKIPSNERNTYPILTNNNLIIGILGICIADAYKPFENVIYLYNWEEI